MATKITPALPKEKSGLVSFKDLKPQDCFLYQGKLWMVTKANEEALCLLDGDFVGGFYNDGEAFLPVDVEIKWSRPKAMLDAIDIQAIDEKERV